MEGGPRLPEDVFMEYKARRAAVLKALTTEVEKFYQECDPEKENLCLYGHTDGTWEVTLPVEEVPPELPEPALGINFARNGMNEKDWLALVAVHSDAWLLGVSFYFGARFGFDRDARKLLFNMINSLPTIFEVVTGLANDSSNGNGANKKRSKDRVSNGNGNGKANKSSSKGGHGNKPPMRGPPKEEEEESEGEEEEREDVNGEGNGGENGEESEEEEHGGNALCGACGNNNGQDQFWICCDVCEQWFHGKCVKITPARAEHIKHYKCPSCSNKRARAN